MSLYARTPLVVRLILVQVVIVLIAVSTVGLTLSLVMERRLDDDYGRYSIGVARSVSMMPEVRAAFNLPDPTSVLQPLAERFRLATGVSFVVIANRDQIRYTHPDPTKIGQQTSTDSSDVLHGSETVRTEKGSLGVSVRGKVPLYDDRGDVIGFVSVGVLERTLSDLNTGSWGIIALAVAVGLALGAIGAFMLAVRVKREILGLEPRQIADIYQMREAMLQSMREGVIAVDRVGCITTSNDEARRLIGLDSHVRGRNITEFLPGCELPNVVRTGQPCFDEMIVHNGRILIANSVPMLMRREIVGGVVTLRDHTEMDGLVREIGSVRQYAEALRAQSHEFSNKLHTIAGMLELGWYDKAVQFIGESSTAHQRRTESVTRYIQNPEVAAVLIGKAGVAEERGVTLNLNTTSRLQGDWGMGEELLTIVGNLVQNAIEEVTDLPAERRYVEVTIDDHTGEFLRIQVRDWGGGVPDAIRTEIFTLGFTTKPVAKRGIGLSLVAGLVKRLGGTITVRNDAGAVFTVVLPLHQATPHFFSMGRT